MNYENIDKECLIEEQKRLSVLVSEVEKFVGKHNKAQMSLWETNNLLTGILESSSAISIISTDKEGNITYWNIGAENIFGYKAREVIGTQNINILYPDPETKELAKQLREKIIKTKKPVRIELKELTKEGKDLWINVTLTARLDVKGDVIGILGIGEDITENRKTQDALKESLEKLEQILESTIHAMVSTFEIKDPYTAGHQKRVANLAKAIGGELGLSKDHINEIYMTAIIHDVGKISIPTEILCKPGKISEVEFNLIKTHAELGYNLLKDIAFPWAISDIVLEHHERLDGSGYPRGLKKEEISFEAKIIAVADVVEAMASNRPYRASLGLEAALQEIKKGSGKIYDAEIADVCTKLFNVIGDWGFQPHAGLYNTIEL